MENYNPDFFCKIFRSDKNATDAVKTAERVLSGSLRLGNGTISYGVINFNERRKNDPFINELKTNLNVTYDNASKVVDKVYKGTASLQTEQKVDMFNMLDKMKNSRKHGAGYYRKYSKILNVNPEECCKRMEEGSLVTAAIDSGKKIAAACAWLQLYLDKVSKEYYLNVKYTAKIREGKSEF